MIKRELPPVLSREECFKIFDNSKKFDEDFNQEKLLKLADWMDNTITDYILIIKAINEDIILRWAPDGIEVTIPEEKRDKIAEDFLKFQEERELSDEELETIKNQVNDVLADLTTKLNTKPED